MPIQSIAGVLQDFNIALNHIYAKVLNELAVQLLGHEPDVWLSNFDDVRSEVVGLFFDCLGQL
jgi:hypothetical protein